MKKLLLLGLLVWSFPAGAQNTQCSDRPSTSSDNSCANTRWVTTHIPAAIPYLNITGVPAHSFLGNNTGSTANAIAMTDTQATAELNLFTSTVKGLAPLSGGGTLNFLRADGTWAPAVQGLANPSALVGLSVINGSASTAMRSDGAPALSQAISPTWTGNHTFNPTSGNALTINPAAASAANGLVVNQSGPSTGTVSPFNYNNITVNGDNANVAGTVNALQVGFGFGGSNMQGQRVVARFLGVLNTASSSSNSLANAYAGSSSEWQFGSSDGGTNLTTSAKGTGLGAYFSAIAVSGATNLARQVGFESNTSLRTGSSAKYSYGGQITQWADSAVSAASIDAGFYFGNQSGAIGWKNYGIVFDSAADGVGTMFQSTATIIGTNGSGTVTNGIDFSSYGIISCAFKAFNICLDGSGNARINLLLPQVTYTIATLPVCTTGIIGGRAVITNGIATPTYHQTVSTTGAATWPVFCTATPAWVYE